MRKWQHDWTAAEPPRGAFDPALVAAIRHIAAPAFVVASSGRVIAANPPGRFWLASQPSGGRALSRRGGPDPACFEVTPSGRDPARAFLAVLRVSSPATDAAAPPVHWCLTPREHEVVELVVRGASNQQIAAALACSPRTVEHHVSSILRKAGVDNRTSLIVALLAR